MAQVPIQMPEQQKCGKTAEGKSHLDRRQNQMRQVRLCAGITKVYRCKTKSNNRYYLCSNKYSAGGCDFHSLDADVADAIVLKAAEKSRPIGTAFLAVCLICQKRG